MVVRDPHDQATLYRVIRLEVMRAASSSVLFRVTRSGVDVLEHQRRVGAAKAERIRQHGAEFNVVPMRLRTIVHVGEGGIDFLDMRALADEARSSSSTGE